MSSLNLMTFATIIGFVLLVSGYTLREHEYGVWMIAIGIFQFLAMVVYTINRQLT